MDMVTVSGDEHWVLLATELKETVYYKFDECKTHIAEALKQRAMEKVLGEYIEKAKSNVDVEIVSTSLREDGNENSDDNHLDHDHSSVLHDEDMPTQAEAGFGEEAEADDFAEEMAQKR